MRKTTITTINCINLALGLILLFLLLTDLELNSTIANYLFPIFVLIAGIVSYVIIKKGYEKKERKKLFLFYLPSFIGVIFFCLSVICFLLFHSFLATMFMIDEEMNKVRIQRSYSPNKTEYCDVYHYPVGAYARGSGRVRVFLVNKYFPFIKKKVLYVKTVDISLDENKKTYEYLEWKDPDTIVIEPNKYEDSSVNIRGICFYPVDFISAVYHAFKD